jgi:hypothetical protein
LKNQVTPEATPEAKLGTEQRIENILGFCKIPKKEKKFKSL